MFDLSLLVREGNHCLVMVLRKGVRDMSLSHYNGTQILVTSCPLNINSMGVEELVIIPHLFKSGCKLDSISRLQIVQNISRLFFDLLTRCQGKIWLELTF